MGRENQHRLPRTATVFLDEPPTIEPRGEFFIATYSSGDAIFSVALTPHSLRAGIVIAQAALAQWEVSQLDVVRPLRRKGR